MAKSMTAYGRASIELDEGHWTLEIFSVNKKALEVQVSLPKDLLYLDNPLRKLISPLVSRGHISIRLTKEINLKAQAFSPIILAALASLKTQWEDAAKKLNLNPEKEITLSFLLENLGDIDLFSEKDKERLFNQTIGPLFQKAYIAFDGVKNIEGKTLATDILKRLSVIEKLLKEIESLVQDLPEKAKLKLLEKLKSLKEVGAELEERAAKEIAFAAEKMDVTEEITRLYSHLAQLRSLLSQEEKPVGKMGEFLLQEAFREVTTLNNKSLDLAVIKLSLEMKSELEKIREQIQNIE